MKATHSLACRAVVAAVCLDFGSNKETITETTERQIEGTFRPFAEDEKKSRIKARCHALRTSARSAGRERDCGCCHFRQFHEEVLSPFPQTQCFQALEAISIKY